MSAVGGYVATARGILVLVLFFAAAGLVAQVFFGQAGKIAEQFPISQTNPFYNAYQAINTAITTAMQSAAPLFTLVVGIIAIGLIWILVRML